MFFIIFFVCLSSNFILIRSEGTEIDNVTITLTYGENCKTLQPSYTFTEGRNVTILVHWSKLPTPIYYSWWQLVGSPNIYKQFTEPYTETLTANKSIEGVWLFKFLHLKDNYDFWNKLSLATNYNGHNYTFALCTTNVTIEPPKSVHVKNLYQKFDSVNANIEQLTRAVNTTKDQNMEINQTIGLLSEQYETILKRLTTYKEQTHELEKKVDLLERNLGASMTDLHNGTKKQHKNGNTSQIIYINGVGNANAQPTSELQHENEDILQNNVTGEVGKVQPTSDSQQNNKDLLQKLIIEFGKALSQPVSQTDSQDEIQSNNYATTNLLLFSQSRFSPTMNDQKSTLPTSDN